jgi:hypothetical protein
MTFSALAEREITFLVRIAAQRRSFEMLPGGLREWQPQWRVLRAPIRARATANHFLSLSVRAFKE